MTTARCTSDAIEGNYEKILSASGAAARPNARPASSTTTTTAEVASSAEKTPVKYEKMNDLSDLPLPAKKRRALAACKKSETRKFARMGSESKCTERVLQGDYESLIEALEYGK
ncbi:unnamed protein product [Sphagnum jensenii]|uniref:Uncharacterized protein n=1 Tax=Sphagnum jensenii TaxID=128206 RepID=A0ABP0VH53_9BRYO